MFRCVLFLLPGLLTACRNSENPGDDDESTPDPFPAFVQDCGGENDEISTASGLPAEDGWRQDDVELCEDDLDVYRIDVPEGRWVAVEIRIDGSGRSGEDGTDLDLWEVPESWEGDIDDALWASASEQPRERLAWHHQGVGVGVHWLAVRGYAGSHGTYQIRVSVDQWDQVPDCDDVWPEGTEAEDGPCNQILQAPQAEGDDEGYLVTHEARYSNIRREVQYLVQWAARLTHERFPDEPPLALMDMSEADGDTPGQEDGSLRHPEGTHVDGNDMDIAYFQTGDDNLGRPVCENDGYFCTEEPDILDARATAWFLGLLLEGDSVRVVGMDPLIWEAVDAAGWQLWQDGEISTESYRRFDDYVAFGSGWPFHHHHMHLSWQWEGGVPRDGSGVTGCMLAPDPEIQGRRP